jgi:hypothetical protein
MKIIIQSRWEGDTKWNYRGEAKNTVDLYHLANTIVSQDRKLRTKNKYKIITQ